jgi:hypothetical protein
MPGTQFGFGVSNTMLDLPPQDDAEVPPTLRGFGAFRPPPASELPSKVRGTVQEGRCNDVYPLGAVWS